ncbi:MAG: hypothetical protein KJ600_03115 [Nanoarchaeota archaeon]|nr:hypothetical protein [Nanoarchaeota archaeon]MBU1103517.1 hypothetical protein [Nanoarchaeota archaeon]
MNRRKIATVGLVAGVCVGFALVGTSLNRAYRVTPETIGDVNGDGVKDALVFNSPFWRNTESISYFDGRGIRKDENGVYYSTNPPSSIPGTTMYRQDPHITNRMIMAGNFDNQPGLDVIIYEKRPHFPLSASRFFMNVGQTPNTKQQENNPTTNNSQFRP